MLRPNSGPYTAATRLACDDSPRSVDYLVSIRGHSRLYEGLRPKSGAFPVNLLNLPPNFFRVCSCGGANAPQSMADAVERIHVSAALPGEHGVS